MRRAWVRTPIPNDDLGHGTHVTSTIAETPNNGLGETGLAYGATIIPIKVLNRHGDGDEGSISAGLIYAANHGAQVINLSFEFGTSTTQGEPDPADRRRGQVRPRQGRA